MKKSPLMPHDTFAAGLRRAFPAFPSAAVLLGLVYYFGLRTAFDYTIGHFEPSALFVLLVVFTILGVILSAIPARLAKNTISVTDVPAGNLCTLFASVMAAVLAVILAAVSILAFTPGTTVVAKLEAFTLPFIALAAIFPFRGSTVHRISAIIGVISVNLTMFSCYFDPIIPINSPVRNLTVIMQSAILLLLLSEARITFGVKSHRITVPFYIFANGTAVILAGGIAFGGLLNRLTAYQPGDPNLSALRLSLYLALAVLAAGRLFALPNVCGKYVEPPNKDNKGDSDEKSPAAEQNNP